MVLDMVNVAIEINWHRYIVWELCTQKVSILGLEIHFWCCELLYTYEVILQNFMQIGQLRAKLCKTVVKNRCSVFLHLSVSEELLARVDDLFPIAKFE